MADEHAQLLETLQRLLHAPAADLPIALTYSADVLADALDADKVDAFLYDETRDSLVAVGTSTQPLSELQRRLGLDVLPVSNGGRSVEVYRTGETFRSGEVSTDAEELRGLREGLKIRSQIGLPLEVAGRRCGMVMIASLEPHRFTAADEAFARSAVGWLGSVAHRAELIEEIEHHAVAQGRRASAEELVTVLAHDLRNHLAPVVSRLYTLRQRAETDGRTDDFGEIGAALEGLADISNLMSDLLDVARIDSGLFALETEPVDLGRLAQEIAGHLSTADHEIVVKVMDAAVAACDPRRIRQCLHNVLTNALDHSPRGAPVHVLVSRTMGHEGVRVQLEIKDEGPGIPEELRPHIFERFRTAGGDKGGLGLGLYLAKQITLCHGGDLSAESGSGRGSRFLVTLPGHSQATPKRGPGSNVQGDPIR